MTEPLKNTNMFEYKSNKELKRALFVFWIFQRPVISSVLQQLLKIALFIKFPVAWAVKKNVYGHFVGGKSLEDCSEIADRMAKYGVGSILDYSVESGYSEEAIKNSTEEIKHSIHHTKNTDTIPFAVFKPSAMTFEWVLEKENKINLSIELEKFEKRMMDLFALARELEVPILVDAEKVAWQDEIDRVVDKGMRIYNKNKAIVFQTLQMYRVDRIEYLNNIIKDAREKGYFPGIKLVRGAYMEMEREVAQKAGKPSPIQPNKQATDDAFNEAVKICVENIDIVSNITCTHNKKSCEWLTALIVEKEIDPKDKRAFLSQLYGMRDDLSFGFAQQGYNVAKYVPYGPVNDVMPYLMRRAEENSSVKEQAAEEHKMLKKELKRRKNKENGNK